MSRWLRPTPGFLAMAAIVVLAVALHGHRRALASYRARDGLVRQAFVRLTVMDRWVGHRMPHVELTEPSGRAVSLPDIGKGAVVWWVDVERCVGCLGAHLDEWQALQRQDGVKGMLALGGADLRLGARMIRNAGIRTPVVFDFGGRLRAAIGIDATAVILVSDADGVILGADALAFGSGDARCGWPALRRLAAAQGRMPNGRRRPVFDLD